MADVVDRYVITVDADGAIKNLERFEGAQKDVNEQAQRQEEALGDAGKSAVNYALKLQVAFEAAKKVGAVLLDSAKAAAESERAQRDLASAIRLVGGDVGKLLPQFSQQATALQKLTGLQDEQIQSLQAQALRYGAAAGDVEKLVEASIRLANVTGQDVNTAMQGLIKTTQGVQDRTLALVPGVRELTEEQLRNGDAVRIVNERFTEALDVMGPTEKAWRDFDNAIEDVKENFGAFLVDGTRAPDILRGMALAIDEVTSTIMDSGGLAGAMVALNIAFGGGDAVLARRERIAADRLAKQAAERRAGGLTFDMVADAGGGPQTRQPAQAAAAAKARGGGGGKASGGGPSVEFDFAGSAADWQAQELAAAQQTIDAKLAMRLRGVELEASIEDQRLAMLDESYQQEIALTQQASDAMHSSMTAAAATATKVGLDGLIALASGAKVSGKQIAAAMVSASGQALVAQGTQHLWSGIAGSMWPGAGNPALIGVGLKEIAIGGAMAVVGGRAAASIGGASASGGGGRPDSAGGFQGGVGGGSEIGRSGSGERKITVIVEGWMSPEEAGHRTKKAIEEANRVGL